MKSELARIFQTLLYTICFLPLSFWIINFLINLFYTCRSSLGFAAIGILTPLLSFFISRRVSKSKKATLLIIGLFLTSLIISIFWAIDACGCRPASPYASAKQLMSQIRIVAEEFYEKDTQYSYENLCTDRKVLDLGQASQAAAKGVVKRTCLGPISSIFFSDTTRVEEGGFNCNDSIDSYAAEVYTKSHDEYWCVDSTGFRGPLKNSIGDKEQCQTY